MDLPLLTVLVVNFNGRRHLGPCFTALEQQTLPRHRFEVVLIDNASVDDSVAFAREQCPWVRVVRSPINTGFAGGNNAGLPFAHGRFLVLLNNDTIADPHWLAELAAKAREGEMAVSKLVFAGDPTTVNSAGLQLLRDGRGLDRGFRHRDCGQFEDSQPVFAGCGAAVLIDTHTFDGPLFDPRYFVYYEDLDAAWRAQLQGLPTQYTPRSLVRHVHGGTAGDESPLFRFYNERNRALTSLRNADLFLAVWNGLGLAARVVRSGFRLLRRRERTVMFRATVGALVSYFALAPFVLVERYLIRTRPTCAS